MSNNLHITSENFADLPKMGLDDTGTMTIKFRVKGASIYDDENMSENISYDMEYEIIKISVEDVTLEEAGRRALNNPAVLVKNTIQPNPAG